MNEPAGTEYLTRLQSHLAELRGYGVTRIGVFGSAVRGELGPSSDIDILVEIEPNKKTYESFLDLAEFLEGLFNGRRVDLVTTKSVSKYILPYVLKEICQIEVA